MRKIEKQGTGNRGELDSAIIISVGFWTQFWNPHNKAYSYIKVNLNFFLSFCRLLG